MNTVNIPKAKDITKDRQRRDRKPLLEEQDILFMKAQESGADTTDIVAEKQRLRDITKDADACATTDELKALTPELKSVTTIDKKVRAIIREELK